KKYAIPDENRACASSFAHVIPAAYAGPPSQPSQPSKADRSHPESRSATPLANPPPQKRFIQRATRPQVSAPPIITAVGRSLLAPLAPVLSVLRAEFRGEGLGGRG